jgi:hypothetical protein
VTIALPTGGLWLRVRGFFPFFLSPNPQIPAKTFLEIYMNLFDIGKEDKISEVQGNQKAIDS